MATSKRRHIELKQFEGYTWPLLLGNVAEWAGLPITEKAAAALKETLNSRDKPMTTGSGGLLSGAYGTQAIASDAAK